MVSGNNIWKIKLRRATLNYGVQQLRIFYYPKPPALQVKVAMTYQHLNQEERYQIYILLKDRKNQKVG